MQHCLLSIAAKRRTFYICSQAASLDHVFLPSSAGADLLEGPAEDGHRVREHDVHTALTVLFLRAERGRLPLARHPRRHIQLPRVQKRAASSTENRRWSSIQVCIARLSQLVYYLIINILSY